MNCTYFSFFLLSLLCVAPPTLSCTVFEPSPLHCPQHKSHHTHSFVTCDLFGQLGNNLFETATISALAWDNGATPLLSKNMPHRLRKHVFFRMKFKKNIESKVQFTWREPTPNFAPISYLPNMKISGYFQSEKHFAHYRQRLLALFSPSEQDRQYIQNKYAPILAHPKSVGVQIRYYKWEDPSSRTYPQYGYEYLKKAMAQFPKDALFVISSNNLRFAKKVIPSFVKNVVFLQDEENYIDLFILSMCKHNIITNSSFGWWGAWLNQNKDKIVLYPKTLFYGIPYQDYCPSTWRSVECKPEK